MGHRKMAFAIPVIILLQFGEGRCASCAANDLPESDMLLRPGRAGGNRGWWGGGVWPMTAVGKKRVIQGAENALFIGGCREWL